MDRKKLILSWCDNDLYNNNDELAGENYTEQDRLLAYFRHSPFCQQNEYCVNIRTKNQRPTTLEEWVKDRSHLSEEFTREQLDSGKVILYKIQEYTPSRALIAGYRVEPEGGLLSYPCEMYYYINDENHMYKLPSFKQYTDNTLYNLAFDLRRAVDAWRDAIAEEEARGNW